LIIGDPILDILRFVEPSEKSNKSNVISTKYLKEEVNSSGVLLVVNFLNLFCKNVTLLFSGEIKNLNLIKKYLGKNIKIKHIQTKNKLIINSQSNSYNFGYNIADKFKS